MKNKNKIMERCLRFFLKSIVISCLSLSTNVSAAIEIYMQNNEAIQIELGNLTSNDGSDSRVTFELQDESDKKYVISLLEKIVFDSSQMDNEVDRREYSLIYPKNLMEYKEYKLDSRLSNVLYGKLVNDIDFYQRLGKETQKMLLENLIKYDLVQQVPFYKMPYRSRIKIVMEVFKNSYKNYFFIDDIGGKIYDLKDTEKKTPIGFSEIELQTINLINKN